MKLASIGYGNFISVGRLVAIVSPEAAPVKRLVGEAKKNNTLIDATSGRRTRAVLIADSGHIILSAFSPETITARISGEAGGEGAATV